MSLITKSALLVVAVSVLLSPLSAMGAKSSLKGKKLIDYGWDTPNSAFVRENIENMEKVPFDGIVISDRHGWKAWSRNMMSPTEMDEMTFNIKATKFKRFTDNFIPLISFSPTKEEEVDWFDSEWSSIAFNAAIMAKAAKQSGCVGILFDAEQYGDYKMWDYDKAKNAHTYEEYLVKVKDRGKEFIRAINREYPDVTILLLWGYEISLMFPEPDSNGTRSYALLRPFLDGICEGADPGTVVVDGYESAYGSITLKPFLEGRDTILTKCRASSSNQEAFDRHVKVGFPVWVDYWSGIQGFDAVDFSRNPYSPGSFRAALSNAMAASDKYVWVYSQKLRWWGYSNPANAPKEYIEALALAKKGPGPGKYPPTIPPKAFVFAGYDDATTFGEMKKTMTEVFDFPKGGWKFKHDKSDSGEKQGWHSASYNDSKWQAISIGKFWDEEVGYHDGYGWYRTKFTAPATSPGKQVFLAVGAVDEAAWVWLNGQPVGSFDEGASGWDKAFALDVTSAIKPGQDNVLAIRVQNRAMAGGVWKSIKLMEK